MQRYQTYIDLPDTAKGASVAMGNFDGVHLGHQSVLALARAAAAEIGAPLGVVTFEPHPRRLFQPDAPAFRLMSAQTRANRFEKLGLDRLYEIPFNTALAALPAETFVTDVLVNGLGIKHLVVGADFRFGKGRSGDVNLLAEMGKTHGFGTTIAPLVNDAKGDFSSTAIRQALSEGRPQDATRMLGHWHRIEGTVEKGFQRGRELGFPTANIPLTDLHLPKYGVYAVLVDVLDGPNKGHYFGAASLGDRPTFADNDIPNLEVFLFDFEGDLYDATLSTALVEYLRPELKFESLDALITAMQDDCIKAREILADYT
ncbi:bifunctional riboflavin kinase/FAD synthetase [Roseobacter sp. N2S]|uniref:bifunctional riboflavin kinase/FAD synthetase n=1 Tax=Roseobacter sp. N2S TaxID=2663844 RepID=UPI002855465D|nr:bifunctional riboflavin kinase/FAD synthetase [Roseobacter sp. N2S]MDR6266094.1 riboflavin kinase/FMN adenylyltransferase [Roseobacter sp. N2S]